MLVIDANVALSACVEPEGFRAFRESLVAPPLMWSEARSVLHLSVHRGATQTGRGYELLERLESSPIERRYHDRLGFEAWTIAERLGWARTYDAEYLALARLLDCRLVTEDRRLRRGGERLASVIGLDELELDL